MVSVVIIIILVLLSSVTLSIALRVKIIHVNLVVVVRNHRLFPWRKDFRQSISNLGVEVGREDHVELQDHPPLLEWVSVLRHALTLNLLQVASLDDFSSNSLDDEGSIVQRLNCLLHTSKRLSQVDVHLDDEVLAASLELIVSFLVQDDNDVPWFQSWFLVALAAECNLLSVLHTFVHLDLQDLSLPVHLPPVTFLAPQLGVNSLPLAVTLLTHGLYLLHHAGAELLDPNLHPSSAAGGTFLHSPSLASQTVASITDDVLLQGQLPHRPVVHVLQGDGQLMDKIFGSPWTSLAASSEWVSATEEHVENVHGVAGKATSTSHSTFLDSLFSALVVETPFIRVGQHLVGIGDLFKLLAGIRIFIRMVFECKLSVGFLKR